MSHPLLTLSTLTVLLSAGAPLMAQSLTTGALIGTVRDSSGQPLAGIVVKATGSQTERTTTTDKSGQYRFGLLGLGQWTLSVQAKGYQTMTTRTTVGINDTQTFNFKLAAVGGATVEITAKPEALSLENTQTSTSFNADILERIPGNATSLYALDGVLATVPSVQSVGNNSFQSMGGTTDQNLYVVDGNITNDRSNNLPQSYVPGLPPREFTQSMEVVTGGFGAEYNVLGAVVNLATRTGTNDFAGETYWYSTLPNAQAKNRFNPQANQIAGPKPLLDTRYGLSLSGPILKDKLFLFLGVQGHKSVAPAVGLGGANWSGYVSSPYTENGPNTLTAKLNWIINQNHELILAGNYVHQTFDSGNSYPSWGYYLGNATGPYNSGSHGWANNQTTNLTWNWVINSELFLVTSLGNHTAPRHVLPNTPSPTANSYEVNDFRYFLTGPGRNATNKPDGWQDFYYVYGSGAGTSYNVSSNKQFRMDLTWAPMGHTVKAGYYLQQARAETELSGSETYYISSPAHDMSWYGDPNELDYVEIGGTISRAKSTYTSVYLKDLWEVAPGLRLDLGVRWDGTKNTGENPWDAGKTRLSWNSPGKQLQPRLSVSWDPNRDGKTKLHGSFGRFYQTMAANNFNWATSTLWRWSVWSANQWTYNPDYGTNGPAFTILTDPATGEPYAPQVPYQSGGVGRDQARATDLKLPYKDAIILGIDHVMSSSWTVGGSWRIWKVKDALMSSYFTNADGSNPFPVDPATWKSPLSGLVVWNPRPGPVTVIANDGSTQTWDSPFPEPKETYITTGIYGKWQGQLGYVQANYTWTHHYGNMRGLTQSTTGGTANNNSVGTGAANQTSDWYFWPLISSGNAEGNPVHELKITGALTLPVFGQKLNLMPVFVWQSGYGLTESLPANKVKAGFSPFTAYWNYYPINGVNGNAGHTPSYSNLDLSANMVIKVGRFTITPSLSILNVFNTHTTLGMDLVREPYWGPTNPTYGQPLTFQAARSLSGGVSLKF